MTKVFFAVIVIAAVFVTIFDLSRPYLEVYTRIIFCNVGQGDAILISQVHFQVLIDGGPKDAKVLSCLARYLPLWDRKIEVVVSTHPDADHLTGLRSVLRYYQVDQLWIEGRATNTQTFRQFQQLVRSLPQLQISIPTAGKRASLPRTGEIEVIFPFSSIGNSQIFLKELPEKLLQDTSEAQERKFGPTNDGSIAILLRIQRFSALFTGDADGEVELALQPHLLSLPITVFKAGHHGSKTSNDLAFLRKIQPEVFVVSVGNKNGYGHPSAEVLERVKSLHSQIYRTDQDGDVVISIHDTDNTYRVTTRE